MDGTEHPLVIYTVFILLTGLLGEIPVYPIGQGASADETNGLVKSGFKLAPACGRWG